MMNRKIRVLICNQYTLFREGMKALFRRGNLVKIVGEAGTAASAIEQAGRLRPEVVLMDMVMPDLGGLDTTLRLKSAYPDAKILIVTMHDVDEQLLARYLEAGASGYVLKGARGPELENAIDAVCGGAQYQAPRAA
jgi:DNA-binding NarL/FixJ family response regulator